ncbi:MAG: hypothetical protein HFE63_01500 [Clostridiales bacterium]|nr:hypothetical protein [Clostridiales bacterium]
MTRLSNLAAELARANIKISSLSTLLNISADSVRNKINGKTEFTVGEALKIQNTYFPEEEMLRLFAHEPE